MKTVDPGCRQLSVINVTSTPDVKASLTPREFIHEFIWPRSRPMTEIQCCIIYPWFSVSSTAFNVNRWGVEQIIETGIRLIVIKTDILEGIMFAFSCNSWQQSFGFIRNIQNNLLVPDTIMEDEFCILNWTLILPVLGCCCILIAWLKMNKYLH